jgi:PAS domain S-box-containing protein
MNDKLKDADGSKDDLDDMVRQRTAELAAANEELSREVTSGALRRKEISSLLEGARAVLAYGDFATSARVIFDECKKIVGATAGYIALLNHDGSENDVVFLDAGGRPCSVDPSLPMPIRGLRAEAYHLNSSVFENDFSNSQWIHFMPSGHVRLDNVMFAPLMIAGKTVGLMGLANKPGGFDDNDARMAAAFGELAAMALNNSRMLKAVEDSEERFHSVSQTAVDAIISINSTGNIVFWNKAAGEMFGWSEEDALGKPVTLVIPEKYHDAHLTGLSNIVNNKTLDSAGRTDGGAGLIGKTIEITAKRRDGGEFPVELSLARWHTSHGVFFTAIIRDISTRKQAEEAIGNYRNRLEEMVEKRTSELILANEKMTAEIEIRKGMEARIRASLDEKEVLLREIHHRVKNNMQIISSLLKLQSRSIDDERLVEMFRISENRIRAMSLIHEKLYQSKDLAAIDMGDYIRNLLKSLMAAYSTSSGNIHLRLELASVLLDVDSAIPCGLVINELIANSLKYAFVDPLTQGVAPPLTQGVAPSLTQRVAPSGARELFVSLKSIDFEGARGVELIIGDNGSGLPAGFDFRQTESLGFQLITSLIENQLSGEIEHTPNTPDIGTAPNSGGAGTRFVIRFKPVVKVDTPWQ